jgi:hypothetical protein
MRCLSLRRTLIVLSSQVERLEGAIVTLLPQDPCKTRAVSELERSLKCLAADTFCLVDPPRIQITVLGEAASVIEAQNRSKGENIDHIEGETSRRGREVAGNLPRS